MTKSPSVSLAPNVRPSVGGLGCRCGDGRGHCHVGAVVNALDVERTVIASQESPYLVVEFCNDTACHRIAGTVVGKVAILSVGRTETEVLAHGVFLGRTESVCTCDAYAEYKEHKHCGDFLHKVMFF